MEPWKRTGTDLYDCIQNLMNNNHERNLVDSKYGLIQWDYLIHALDLDSITFLSMTGTEFRRLCSLVQSLGVNVDEFVKFFIDEIEYKDFEMFSEWMKYMRNKKMDFDSDHMYEMNFYAVKFEMDVRDIFKYIYNDDDGEYLKFITEYLTSYPDYPTYFPDDWLYPEPDEGRYFDIMSEDVEELIAGKLIK